MEIEKQYMLQCISVAANNLRLSTEKIEILALLREAISKSNKLEDDIRNMKKVTEFSKIAIRFWDIYIFITQNKIDFQKLSEKFKEHSQLLVKDLNILVENNNLSTFKIALQKLQSFNNTKTEVVEFQIKSKELGDHLFVKAENERMKENLILEDEKDDDEIYFQNFEATIMKPIKDFDILLKKLQSDTKNVAELDSYLQIMKVNTKISEKFGTEIITSMHKIIYNSLMMIKLGDSKPDKETIDSIRACLIVIVALVRNKEVDIKNYLNRAEEFGKKIKSYLK
ncbi:MAG: hypothetical protein C0425_11180 [Chlorobiaceae bacterium]|nr:hypothetical protein [Chlorobiaceae bacterium]